MKPNLDRTRYLTGALCLFDIGLGITAVFFPRFYMNLIQPTASDDPAYLLQRTGALWLCFAFCEGMAFFRYARFPEWVVIVAALRLIDVPADLVYWFRDHALDTFGKFSLIFAPAFNATAGTLLAVWYIRFRKETTR